MALALPRIGTELMVSDLDAAADPSIAALAEGGFAVAWMAQSQYNGDWQRDVFARVSDASGNAPGT